MCRAGFTVEGVRGHILDFHSGFTSSFRRRREKWVTGLGSLLAKSGNLELNQVHS